MLTGVFVASRKPVRRTQGRDWRAQVRYLLSYLFAIWIPSDEMAGQ
jgi:hypothetical protein